jgi:hypothetical protein
MSGSPAPSRPLLPLLLILLCILSAAGSGSVQAGFKSGADASGRAESFLLGAIGVVAIAILILVALVTAGTWKVFEKAGQPGWAAVIPVYSWIVMLRVVEKPSWWVLLMCIPFIKPIGNWI